MNSKAYNTIAYIFSIVYIEIYAEFSLLIKYITSLQDI